MNPQMVFLYFVFERLTNCYATVLKFITLPKLVFCLEIGHREQWMKLKEEMVLRKSQNFMHNIFTF